MKLWNVSLVRSQRSAMETAAMASSVWRNPPLPLDGRLLAAATVGHLAAAAADNSQHEAEEKAREEDGAAVARGVSRGDVGPARVSRTSATPLYLEDPRP